MKFKTNAVEETIALGEALGAYAREYKGGIAFALVGDLGTGKTHMAQGIAKGFGVKEDVTSPTFALMNTYEVDGDYLYHFDLYRLDSLDELETIGFYEFTEDTKSIIEWANLFEDEMPEETLWLHFHSTGEGERIIEVTGDVWDEAVLTEIGGQYVLRD